MKSEPLTKCFPMLILLCLLAALLLANCIGKINVMGRDVPDSEYKASYDLAIIREKQGLEPTDVHDEYGRIPSWDQFWCTIGGTQDVTKPARSRRLKRYIITQRRAAGLRELSSRMSFIYTESNTDSWPSMQDHYYKSGDPRIFQ